MRCSSTSGNGCDHIHPPGSAPLRSDSFSSSVPAKLYVCDKEHYLLCLQPF